MSITLSDDSKKDVRSRSSSLSSKTKSENLSHKIEPLPGSLCSEYIRCGRSNCKCAKGQLHGPYYYRFWYVGRKRRKKYVKKGDFQTVSEAVLANRRNKTEIREMIRELKKDSRQLADLLNAYDRLLRIGV